MTAVRHEPASEAWAALQQRASLPARQRLAMLAHQHADHLASRFYEQMLADPVSAALLSHEQVQTRLHRSMQRWVATLLADGDESGPDIEQLLAQQLHIGDVHARINVPVHLVLRGARYLKDELLNLLRDDEALQPGQRLEAMQLMLGRIDLAMEIMSQGYGSSQDRNVRTGEAYRLFAITQNLGTEKERQRAALLDWENQLMFDLVAGLDGNQLPLLRSAEFGLWFRHKGAHAFDGTKEAQLILQAMARIDEELLPQFDRRRQLERELRLQYLRELREQAKSIAYNLDWLFEQSSELEAGRDVLTQLLNRKFLPAVLRKEVHLARENSSQFAILAIDIDHFKHINDRHGHDAGDSVLQQVAKLLNNHTRSGDYLFRLGGEEFLVVLVDITPPAALKAAESLRRRIEAEPFRIAGPGEPARLTISAGLALHGGHPDYQRTLQAADRALYQAKREGRNRVVHATP